MYRKIAVQNLAGHYFAIAWLLAYLEHRIVRRLCDSQSSSAAVSEPSKYSTEDYLPMALGVKGAATAALGEIV